MSRGKLHKITEAKDWKSASGNWNYSEVSDGLHWFLPSNVKAMNTSGKKCLTALPSTLCPPCLYPRVVPKKFNKD